MMEADRDITDADINAELEETLRRGHPKQLYYGRDPMHYLLEKFPGTE